MLAVDHAMVQGLGRGLGSFKDRSHPECTPDMPEPAQRGHRQATLTMSADQCSMNLCFYWYLVYECGFHIMFVPDYFHRLWNDCKQAIVDAGWWSTIPVSCFMQNVLFGPWESSKFYSDVRTGVKEYAAAATTDDPLLVAFSSGLLRDRQEEHRAMEPGIMKVLLDRVVDSREWNRMGEKTSMNRWFQWVRRAREFDAVWHEKLIVQAFMGLQLGWLKRRRSTCVMDPA
jgi:hypothetical protein